MDEPGRTYADLHQAGPSEDARVLASAHPVTPTIARDSRRLEFPQLGAVPVSQGALRSPGSVGAGDAAGPAASTTPGEGTR